MLTNVTAFVLILCICSPIVFSSVFRCNHSRSKLESLCLHATPTDVNWSAGLAECGWLYHVRTMLSASLFTAEAMHRKGQSVVVHW